MNSINPLIRVLPHVKLGYSLALLSAMLFVISCHEPSPPVKFVEYKNYIRTPIVFMNIPEPSSISEEEIFTEFKTLIENEPIDIMIAYSIKDSLQPIDSAARIGGMANMIWCSYYEVSLDTCSVPRIWKAVKCGNKIAYYLVANSECSAMISFSAPVDVDIRYRILNSIELWKK